MDEYKIMNKNDFCLTEMLQWIYKTDPALTDLNNYRYEGKIKMFFKLVSMI